MSRVDTRCLSIENLLLSAVGGNQSPYVGIDSDLYFSILELHRIESRAQNLHGRFFATHAPALHGKLQDRLEELSRNAFAQLEAISSLVDKLGDDVEPLVVLKGLRKFLRTGDLSVVRKSGDVDALASPRTAKALAELDGIGLHNSTGRLPPHELVHFDYRSVFFDVHEYVPICQPPSSLSQHSFIGKARYRRIEYQYIRNNAILAENCANGNVLIPRSEVAALVSISSMYYDYLAGNLPSGRNRTPVRLNEMLELKELLEAPDFEMKFFQEAVRDHEMEHQLKWAADVLEILFPNNGLLGAFRDRTGDGFPHCRTLLYGLWYNCGLSLKESIASHPSTSLLAQTLNANFPTVLGPQNDGRRGSFYDVGTSERILDRTVDCTRRRASDELAVKVTVVPTGKPFRVVVESQGDVFQFYVEAPGLHRFRASNSGSARVVSWHYEAGTAELRLRDRAGSEEDDCLVVSVSEFDGYVYNSVSIAVLPFPSSRLTSDSQQSRAS